MRQLELRKMVATGREVRSTAEDLRSSLPQQLSNDLIFYRVFHCQLIKQ